MKVLLVFAIVVALAHAEIHARYGFPSGRVVGGWDAEKHSAPYIVSLQQKTIFGSQHFCGGSLISSEWVVTAAHCLVFGKIEVVAGLHNLKDTQGTQARSSAQIIQHEKYSGGVGPFDIGLIRVSKPFDLNDVVKAVKLPVAEHIHSGVVTLHGWGSTSTTHNPIYPNILQTVTKPIIKYSECEDVLGGKGNSPLAESNVCTGPLNGGVSACSGDSGGPLVQQNKRGEVELVGIVSWGYIPCGSVSAPSVYTRTSAYIQWINGQISI